MSTVFLPAERSPRLRANEEPITAPRTSFLSELMRRVFPVERDHACRPVMVSAARRQSGVSTFASCLALELLTIGDRILLLDAKALLQLAQRAPGLAVTLADPLKTDGLWVLGAKQMQSLGEDPPRRSRSSIAAVLSECSAFFTHVIVDAASLEEAQDAMEIAAYVHGTLLLVSAGLSKKELDHACRQLQSVGGKLLGTVFNGHQASSGIRL